MLKIQSLFKQHFKNSNIVKENIKSDCRTNSYNEVSRRNRNRARCQHPLYINILLSIFEEVGVKRNRAANGVVGRGSCAASHSPVSGARAHVGGACAECAVFALFSICPVNGHRNSGAIFSLVGIQRLYRDLIYLFLSEPLSFRFMRVDLFMRFIGLLIQVTKRFV